MLYMIKLHGIIIKAWINDLNELLAESWMFLSLICWFDLFPSLLMSIKVYSVHKNTWKNKQDPPEGTFGNSCGATDVNSTLRQKKTFYGNKLSRGERERKAVFRSWPIMSYSFPAFCLQKRQQNRPKFRFRLHLCTCHERGSSWSSAMTSNGENPHGRPAADPPRPVRLPPKKVLAAPTSADGHMTTGLPHPLRDDVSTTTHNK